jgi:hypothetical protein
LGFPITQFDFEATIDRGHWWASIQPKAGWDDPGQNLTLRKGYSSHLLWLMVGMLYSAPNISFLAQTTACR